MRASGVVLVVLIFGHLFINLVPPARASKQVDFAFVAGKFASTRSGSVWDVLMLWLALIHGANGMRTIINDYVDHTGRSRRLLRLGARRSSAAFLIVLGTLVVFTFDPCLGASGPQRGTWPAGPLPFVMHAEYEELLHT